MHGAEWALTSLDYSQGMYDPGRLVLTYTTKFEYLNNMTLYEEDQDANRNSQY
jgi:hypothetical protein